MLLLATVFEPLLPASFDSSQSPFFETLDSFLLDLLIEACLLLKISLASFVLERLSEGVGVVLHEGQQLLCLARALPLLAQVGQALIFHIRPQLLLLQLILGNVRLDLFQLNATLGTFIVIELNFYVLVFVTL